MKLRKLLCTLLSLLLLASMGTSALAQEPAFTELEVSLFEGGFGDMWKELVELFQQKYPDVKVTADISPDNAVRVRARMLAGSPPDVINVMPADFNPFEAAASGQLLSLNDMFANGETADGRKYADVINPSILQDGSVHGEVYLPPFGTTYGGWWYDQTLFDEKGWTVPNTWDEFLALAPKIKEAGIAPFVYAGFYPNYLIHGYMYAAVAAAGGYTAFEDAFVNLKEGAWSSDAVKEAATKIYDLAKAGYIYEGVTGIDHTQSQMEFLNGRAAFLPCGTWLEIEMKDSIPENFKLSFMPSPQVDKDGHHYLTTYSPVIGVTAKAKNPEAAKAFLGVLYSQEGQKIVAKYSNIPIITDLSAEEFGDSLTPALKTVVDRARQDDIIFVSNNTETWYSGLNVALKDNVTNLVLGEITPDQFCETMEAVAKTVREDDSVPKYYTTK